MFRSQGGRGWGAPNGNRSEEFSLLASGSLVDGYFGNIGYRLLEATLGGEMMRDGLLEGGAADGVLREGSVGCEVHDAFGGVLDG